MSDEPQQAPEFGQRIFEQLMTLWVTPEVQRRQESGDLPRPLRLQAAQVIFFPDGRAPSVLVNSEVTVNAKLRFKDGVTKNAGDPIYAGEVSGLEGVELTNPEHQNCGHATMMLFLDTWHIAFDFRYHKQQARVTLTSAREFLDAARFSIDRRAWASAVDNMFSAAELCSKALLMPFQDGEFARKATHGAIHSRINHWSKLGNVDPEHVKAYNRLHSWRTKARYPTEPFQLSADEAEKCLAAIEEMYAFASSRA